MENNNYTVRRGFGSYNQRRYSCPWGAIVTLSNGKPAYNFCGFFTGNHRNGTGGDVIISNATPGQIVAFGQKDNRNPKYTENDWYVVDNEGNLQDISRNEAIGLLISRQ